MQTGEEDPRKIIYSKGQHPETGKSLAFERDKKEGSQDAITAVLFTYLQNRNRLTRLRKQPYSWLPGEKGKRGAASEVRADTFYC